MSALPGLFVRLGSNSGKYRPNTACQLILHVVAACVSSGYALSRSRPHIRHAARCSCALKRCIRSCVHLFDHLSRGDASGLFVGLLSGLIAGLFALYGCILVILGSVESCLCLLAKQSFTLGRFFGCGKSALIFCLLRFRERCELHFQFHGAGDVAPFGEPEDHVIALFNAALLLTVLFVEFGQFIRPSLCILTLLVLFENCDLFVERRVLSPEQLVFQDIARGVMLSSLLELRKVFFRVGQIPGPQRCLCQVV